MLGALRDRWGTQMNKIKIVASSTGIRVSAEGYIGIIIGLALVAIVVMAVV